MEALKALVEKIPDATSEQLIEDIPKMMALVKEVGFLQVVKDEDLKDFIEDMREKMVDIDIEALVPLSKVVMPTLIEGMAELLANSEEAQEEMAEMEDVTVEVSVPSIDVYLNMSIIDGKFSGGDGKLPDAELKLGMNKNAFLNLLRNEGDLVSAYMGGDVTLEGPLNKAMLLQSLFEILSDEFDFDLGLM